MSFLTTLKRTFTIPRRPDFKIGRTGDWYIDRWYVIPRNRWFNIYLHHTMRSDDPAALHDHPWWNASIVLRGGYFEVMPRLPGASFDWAAGHSDVFGHDTPVTYTDPIMRQKIIARYQRENTVSVWRRPGSVIFRRATDAHLLELGETIAMSMTPPHGIKEIPSWSLFITGPKRREWGFWCKKGWVPFTQYVKENADGNEVGAGCGEQS